MICGLGIPGFQSTLPVGGATIEDVGQQHLLQFQSTLPVGGATCPICGKPYVVNDFNPRSPWGERPGSGTTVVACEQFQSTLPVGGATSVGDDGLNHSFMISIHAPRGGSDPSPPGCGSARAYFNPRSPWGERRPPPAAARAGFWTFQSTLPVGGATERPAGPAAEHGISIHAPRGGSDAPAPSAAPSPMYFNPRSPWGERQEAFYNADGDFIISIHAPRGGSDVDDEGRAWVYRDFNPRSPWGERLILPFKDFGHIDFNPRSPWGERPSLSWIRCPAPIFQSTLPVGGATPSGPFAAGFGFISIHAPRGGSDQSTLPVGGSDAPAPSAAPSPMYFNPRSPWGERQEAFYNADGDFIISIHAPRGGSDVDDEGRAWVYRDFNPRSPWGERLILPFKDFGHIDFNPRSPWGERPSLSWIRCPAPIFQSTLPVGGATPSGPFAAGFGFISIHAPRGGSDFSTSIRSGSSPDFNPRSPWGERLPGTSMVQGIDHISIHAPRGGSDGNIGVTTSQEMIISIHAPRGGSDPVVEHKAASVAIFQSTLPVGGATADLHNSTSAN